jgi:RND family efflux transporter MFP subunit
VVFRNNRGGIGPEPRLYWYYQADDAKAHVPQVSAAGTQAERESCERAATKRLTLGQEVRSVKMIIKVVLWVIVLSAAAFGLYHLYGYTGQNSNTPAEAAERPEAPLVRVTEVKRGTLTQRVYVTGTIQPDFSTRVMPEVAGVLEKFELPDGTPIEEGVQVQRGAVIAVIEHKDLAAALEEAKANVRVAESSLEETRVRVKDAERERDRMVELCKQGACTERERDAAVTAYEAALARQQLAKDTVEQTKATLKKVRARYDDATVEAPISGVVSKKYVDRGSYVNPSTPIARIVNIAHVEIKGGVAGKYFPALRPGHTTARVEVDAYPDERFGGVVQRMEPELDPVTRTFEVTLRIENPQQKLKPGMFARIHIIAARREDVPVIPDAALVSTEDDTTVFLVEEDTANLKSVRLGIREGAMVEVADGLKPGDVVVTRGHHLLEDGARVRTNMGTAE